jgi:hypothetical protein
LGPEAITTEGGEEDQRQGASKQFSHEAGLRLGYEGSLG